MADVVVPAAIRALRAVVRRGIAVAKERISQTATEVEPALARNPPRLHPIARIRQSAATNASNRLRYDASEQFTRYYTTATNNARARVSPLKSAVGKLTTVSPFSSTLRPKLCGALPRSAGGYSLGGGATRAFSHTPAAPAQVIQQVSQAMRAFILSGKDVRYRQNQQYVRGTIKAQLAAAATDKLAPGAYVDFRVTPNMTCLSASDSFGTALLDDAQGGFLDALNLDFQSTIRDISAIYQDMRRLSRLGELPVSLVEPHTLRVHFYGCDAEMVTRLCDEVGVCRGIIHEDERFAFDRIMPSNNHDVDWREMLSSSGESESGWSGSICSQPAVDINLDEIIKDSPWGSGLEEDYDEIEPGGETSSSEGYGSYKRLAKHPVSVSAPKVDCIDTFLAECEQATNSWALAGKA